MKEIYSPDRIAEMIMTIDPDFYLPSDEQRPIISIDTNPLEPAVVIAGAGSGKTETMAARVLYLVANQFARPDQILGLTFTRKASGELNTRIRKRLRQFQQAQDRAGIEHTFSSLETAVTTYHSYAGRLLSEHAIRYGIDADVQPLGEAALWISANKLVREWDNGTFATDDAVSTVVKDLLGLTSMVIEHRVSLDAIRAVDEEVLQQLSQMTGATNEETRRVAKVLNQRITMLPMVTAFIESRRKSGELSYDDQIALAADIAVNFPDVGVLERGKYPVVLLDEYQDTSQSQVRMLAALFGGGHPVTAVGDPCQSIYTWRGASAGTIGVFNKNFPKAAGAKGKDVYELLTTYRNDKAILELANEISDGVRQLESVKVERLKARKGAGAGDLTCGVFENLEAESVAIAEYFAPLWNNPERSVAKSKVPKTFAVLVRKRAQIPYIQSALATAGIPAEVLGLGGLVHVPEIADLVAMLKVLNDPDAGASLMRHIAGARLNLGPRDIAALGQFARKRSEKLSTDSRSIVKNIVAGNPDSAEADDQFIGSLIDALDEIEKCDRRNFSEVGYQRLSAFASDLRRLRARASAPITDLIVEIERYLGLEAEVMLRDGGTHGRRHLDRFMDEAAKFVRSGGSLSSFLQWLDVASEEEGGLKAGTPEVDVSVVQILTIHMAKGAEWDVVAVPGLAQGTFPGANKSDPDNWITNERHIPFALRGDGDLLPHFSWNAATTNAQAKAAIENFAGECVSYKEREEIRLGYVAMTRARTHLFCSTSYWRDGVKPVPPSVIYTKVEEVAAKVGTVLASATAPADGDRNPAENIEITAVWPQDSLGDKRTAFDQSVELVRSATVLNLSEDIADENGWVEDARAIIAEYQELRRGAYEVALPPRLSTSTLIALHEDGATLAENVRRPMPRVMDEFSHRGTAFHLWIEGHFKAKTLFDDEDFDTLTPLPDDQKLEDLKAKWLASDWAKLQPYAVEVPFETVIAGILVRGRIDAVYKTENGFEVVDWKTGSKELGKSAAVQLAVYRLAWAKLQAVPVEKVIAAFHYVPIDKTDRRADLLTEEQLVDLLTIDLATS
jgi:DNA helicase II / ATP-dependent DNA helicase PcrA|uniref:UvrD-helicase domain-containing protein n=1 Tax=Candidatus Planktophila sp. TaxID=2175601 RepID=UPI00404B7D1B